MLLCASVLAQSGFARPRQQHRVPLTRCRVARTQVPNRLHPLRRRASSSRSRCIRTLQADRGRVQVTSGAKKWDCDSRPRRLIFPGPARTQGPSTRRATTTQGRHRPGARFKSTTPPLCPHSLTTRVSLSRRFLFRLATLRVSRGCEMGCAGDARQASVPAATSDRHTQHRLTRHTRGAPRASRRRRRASEPGPLTPSVPREPAVTVEPFPSARADRATSGLCRPSRHAQSFGPRPRGSPRVHEPRAHESPAAHSGGHPAARLRTPPHHRESAFESDRVRRSSAHCGVSILLQLHPSHSRTINEERGCRPADTAVYVRPTAAPVIWRQGHVSSAPRRRRIRSLSVTCLRALALRVQRG